MQTGKPLVSILMAVYEPRMDWLAEQLLSLEAQTYPNLRLYILDDCSPTVPFESIQACAERCIRSFPYEIRRNEKNLGSTRSFERLTLAAEGEYFAYCDQDDVWLPEKLSTLAAHMAEPGVQLVCSDVRVIDAEGRELADSITKVRHRHRFLSGQQAVFRSLLTRNFVIGCTMLVRRDTALGAVPFLREMVHDHWLALFAASRGKVLALPEPLICYRIHGGNQTGVLTGVSNRREYVELRILAFEKRIRQIRGRFPESPEIDRAYQWAEARAAFAVHHRRGSAFRLWRLRAENWPTTLFELFALWAPESLFRQALRIAKKSG